VSRKKNYLVIHKIGYIGSENKKDCHENKIHPELGYMLIINIILLLIVSSKVI
jgi:hypothetical protein